MAKTMIMQVNFECLQSGYQHQVLVTCIKCSLHVRHPDQQADDACFSPLSVLNIISGTKPVHNHGNEVNKGD